MGDGEWDRVRARWNSPYSRNEMEWNCTERIVSSEQCASHWGGWGCRLRSAPQLSESSLTFSFSFFEFLLDRFLYSILQYTWYRSVKMPELRLKKWLSLGNKGILMGQISIQKSYGILHSCQKYFSSFSNPLFGQKNSSWGKKLSAPLTGNYLYKNSPNSHGIKQRYRLTGLLLRLSKIQV